MLTSMLHSILFCTNPDIAKEITFLVSEHAPKVLLYLFHSLVIRCHTSPDQAERMRISVIDVDVAVWCILKQVLCHVAAGRA